MGFVNEKLTDEIIAKYDLNNVFPRGWRPPQGNKWTVDKERNIWLFRAHSSEAALRRDGWKPKSHEFWGYFWGEQTYTIKVEMVGTEEEQLFAKEAYARGETVAVRHIMALTYCDVIMFSKLAGYTFPPNMQGNKEDFFKDLKEAFTVYKAFGAVSDKTIEICHLVFSVENYSGVQND